jgi:hypothetical protein
MLKPTDQGGCKPACIEREKWEEHLRNPFGNLIPKA